LWLIAFARTVKVQYDTMAYRSASASENEPSCRANPPFRHV
jgi:hypothetical protein